MTIRAVRLLLLLGFFSVTHIALAQKDQSREAVLLDLAQLQDSVRMHPKPVLLLFHTDWCVYCALQKEQLDSSLTSGNVYFAEFDAGQREEVFFNGKRFAYRATGKNTGVHGLVVEMAGQIPIEFPLWVLLSPDLEVVDTYAGYLRPEELRGLVDLLANP